MPRRGMSQAHKDALAKGRRQGKAVRDYLEALQASKARTGRRPNRGNIEQRIQDIQAQIDEEENAARRVELIQRRLDLERQLTELDQEADLDHLEEGFKEAVKEYSERKGITYSAWREAGVPASVLRDAGVPRTRAS